MKIHEDIAHIHQSPANDGDISDDVKKRKFWWRPRRIPQKLAEEENMISKGFSVVRIGLGQQWYPLKYSRRDFYKIYWSGKLLWKNNKQTKETDYIHKNWVYN